MNISGALALFFFFKEEYAGIIETPNNSRKNSAPKESHLPMYDRIAAFTCYLTRFTQMFINTTLETIGTAFAMMMFGFGSEKGVFAVAMGQGGVGILTFATYLAYIFLKLEK